MEIMKCMLKDVPICQVLKTGCTWESSPIARKRYVRPKSPTTDQTDAIIAAMPVIPHRLRDQFAANKLGIAGLHHLRIPSPRKSTHRIIESNQSCYVWILSN